MPLWIYNLPHWQLLVLFVGVASVFVGLCWRFSNPSWRGGSETITKAVTVSSISWLLAPDCSTGYCWASSRSVPIRTMRTLTTP